MPRFKMPGDMDRSSLIKRVDEAFSLFIRGRDGYRCFTCGKTKAIASLFGMSIQAGHLFSRTNYSTRWDELNTHAQCSGCNSYHENHPEGIRSHF